MCPAVHPAMKSTVRLSAAEKRQRQHENLNMGALQQRLRAVIIAENAEADDD